MLPAVVGVDVRTWIVSVSPSTVEMYIHVFIITTCTQKVTAHCADRSVPALTSFTAGCRLMLGPLTAHTFTL